MWLNTFYYFKKMAKYKDITINMILIFLFGQENKKISDYLSNYI